ALARALAANALRQHEQLHHDELAALLARQAYLLDQASGGQAHDQVDDALRTILGADHFSMTLRGIAATFSAGGTQLAVGEGDGAVRLYRLTGTRGAVCLLPGEEMVLPGDGSPVRALAFNHAGTVLAVGHAGGMLHLWGLRRRTPEPASVQLAGHP